VRRPGNERLDVGVVEFFPNDGISPLIPFLMIFSILASLFLKSCRSGPSSPLRVVAVAMGAIVVKQPVAGQRFVAHRRRFCPPGCGLTNRRNTNPHPHRASRDKTFKCRHRRFAAIWCQLHAQRRINDRQRTFAFHVIHAGHSQYAAEFLRRHFIGPGFGAVPGAGCGNAVDIAVWNVMFPSIFCTV